MAHGEASGGPVLPPQRRSLQQRFGPHARARDGRGTVRRLLALYARWGRELLLVVCLTLLSTGAALAVPYLLGRAVDNLLSNAALYSPAGARIRVRTLRLDGRPTLVVENTGVQIGAEALPRLFEPFYREEQSRNRRTGGSGLGLYLVKMILDRHGARCEIENITDGVRARVIFPPETAS